MPKPLRQLPRELPALPGNASPEAMRADAEEVVRAFLGSGVPDHDPSWRAARDAFLARYSHRAEALIALRRAYLLREADLTASRTSTTRKART